MTLETWLKIDSVISLKTGKHSDFRISSFQVVDAWRILQFKRKTENF